MSNITSRIFSLCRRRTVRDVGDIHQMNTHGVFRCSAMISRMLQNFLSCKCALAENTINLTAPDKLQSRLSRSLLDSPAPASHMGGVTGTGCCRDPGLREPSASAGAKISHVKPASLPTAHRVRPQIILVSWVVSAWSRRFSCFFPSTACLNSPIAPAV